jgi:alpha-glucosidase
MTPRTRRLHGLEGVGALASMPIDGRGIKSVERQTLGVRTKDVRGIAHCPTLVDGKHAGAAVGLTSVPQRTHLPGRAPKTPRVRFEYDGSTVRAQVDFGGAIDLYGAGLAAGALKRNGRVIEFWNTDAWRYGEHSPALYQSHPFALAMRSDGSAIGVLTPAFHRGQITFASDGIELAFEDDPFDVFVLEAAHPSLVLRALVEMTGRIEMPPLWALGYHQCRWSYESADEVRELAREFRARKIPCDAIWLDIDYMDRHRVFTWNRERFPEPAQLIDELHRGGFRSVAIVDPGIATDLEYEAFKSGVIADAFVTDGRRNLVEARVWPGNCLFPDFFTAKARDWWAAHVSRFVECGLDGLWCDMNEPSVFRTPARTLPDWAQHLGNLGGAHDHVHNLYGQLMARATRDGLLAARPQQRPFVLTRSNFISGSRFAATWTGDNQATWEDLRWSIPMVLSLGLCGQPFSGVDIGGFDGDPSGELFARWFELGAYLPFARGHSEKTACRKEPWSFGPEIERCVRAALERRMQLLPTLYTLFHEACVTGLPIARPMFYADPQDASLRAIDDQFMLGEDLLVAPIVHAGASEREVVLPATRDGWFRFDGEANTRLSGRIRAAAPLGTTPAFARAGSIVATKPSAGHTAAQARLAPILNVFFDADGRAQGTLYEDDGEHRSKRARLTHFSARIENARAVVEAESQGEFSDVARPWTVVAHGSGA